MSFILNPLSLVLLLAKQVGRQATDISALVDEYLRFMFLRQRLEGMLTLDPSPLVDDVWQTHIASERCGAVRWASCWIPGRVSVCWNVSRSCRMIGGEIDRTWNEPLFVLCLVGARPTQLHAVRPSLGVGSTSSPPLSASYTYLFHTKHANKLSQPCPQYHANT